MKKVVTSDNAKKPEVSSLKIGGGGATNVKVVCRVRPMNEMEKSLLTNANFDAKGNKIRDICTEFNKNEKSEISIFTPVDKMDKSEKDPYEKHIFNFDYVFECGTTQPEVYEVAAKPIIESN